MLDLINIKLNIKIVVSSNILPLTYICLVQWLHNMTQCGELRTPYNFSNGKFIKHIQL